MRIKFKRVIAPVLVLFVCLNALFVTDIASGEEGGDTTTLTELVTPENTISALTLTAGQTADDGALELSFALELNRTYLAEALDALTVPSEEDGSPVNWLETAGPEAAPEELAAELNAMDDDLLPAIAFSVRLEGPFATDANPADTGVIESDGAAVGTYALTTGEGGILELSAALNREVYLTRPASAAFIIHPYVTDERAIGFSPVLRVNGDTVSASFPTNPPGGFEPINLLGGSADEPGTFDMLASGMITFAGDGSFPEGPDQSPLMPYSDITLKVEAVNKSNQFPFWFFATMNSEYLQSFIENEDPVETFPSLDYSFDMASTFTAPTGANGTGEIHKLKFPDTPQPILTATGQIIGEITFSAPVGGVVTITVNMDEAAVYGAAAGGVSVNVTCGIDGTGMSGWIPELEERDDDGVLQTAWIAPADPTFPADKNFKITKIDNSPSGSDVGVTYRLSATAALWKDRPLNGTAIVDILNVDAAGKGLNVVGFTVTLRDKSGSVIDAPTPVADYKDYLYAKAADMTGFDPYSHNLTPLADVEDASELAYGEVFIYPIPEGDPEVWSVDIELRTMLNQTAYQYLMEHNYPGNNASTSLSLKNKGSLYYQDDEVTKREDSGEVTTNRNFSFLKKDGGKVSGSSQEIQWTLTGKTYFTNVSGVAYILDQIPAPLEHDFKPGSESLTVNGDARYINVPATAADLTAHGLSEDPIFANIGNASFAAKVWEAAGGASGTTAAAVRYTFDGDSYMMIRLGAEDIDAPFTVKYTTVAKKEANDLNLANNAKIIVAPNTYEGGWGIPGEAELPQECGGEVTKNVPLDHHLATKGCTSYDEKTQTATWAITLNQFKQHVSDITLKDTFSSADMALLTVGGVAPGNSFTTGSGPSARTFSYITDTSGATGDYYTFEPDANGICVLTIHIAEVTADELETLTIPYTTKVINAEKLNSQYTAAMAAAAKVTNHLEYTGTIIEEGDVTGSKDVTYTLKNTLLSKSVEKFNSSLTYDYAEGVITWTLGVNPNSLHIKDAVVTDVLPSELIFGDITKITYGGTVYTGNDLTKSGNVYTAGGLQMTVTPVFANVPYNSAAVNGADRDVFTLGFKDTGVSSADSIINKPVVVTFTTKIKESFKSAPQFSDSTAERLTNRSYLDGIIGQRDMDDEGFSYESGKIDKNINLTGHPYEIYEGTTIMKKTARASAETTLTLPGMKKDGEFFKFTSGSAGTTIDGVTYKTDKVLWKLLVNRDRYAGAVGAAITDNINSGGDYFALNPQSLKVYAVTLNPDGTLKTNNGDVVYDSIVSEYPAFTGFTKVDRDGFKFVIPENKTYLIEFEALVTTDQKLTYGQIKNTASIEYTGAREDEAVTGDTGENTGSTAHAAGYLEYLPSLVVVKSGTEAENYTGGLPDLRLNGVTFQLQGYPITGSSAGSITVDWSRTVSTKTSVTGIRADGSNGVAYFPLLFPDTLYVLTETDVGGNNYTLNTGKRYFVVPRPGQLYPAYTLNQADVQVALEKLVPGKQMVYYAQTPPAASGITAPYGHSLGELSNPDHYSAAAVVLNAPVPPEGGYKGIIVGTKENTRREKLAGAQFRLYPTTATSLADLDAATFFETAVQWGQDVTSNANGEFRFVNVPIGYYVLKEVMAPSAATAGRPYELSEQLYLVHVTGNAGENEEEVVSKGMYVGENKFQTTGDITFVNMPTTPSDARIVGHKVNQNGRSLAGAKLGLFTADTTEFTEANALRVATSGTDGTFIFDDLPPGPTTYYIRELSAPSGYALNNRNYTVQVTGDGYARQGIEPEIVTTFENGRALTIVNSPPERPGNEDPDNPPGGGDDDDGGDDGDDDDDDDDDGDDGGDDGGGDDGGGDDGGGDDGGGDDDGGGGDDGGDDGDSGGTPPPAPPIDTVSPENVFYPPQLPEGYSAVQIDDNTYVIYDEDGTPLGYVIVPEGQTLDDINILEEMIPYGKANPQTGDDFRIYVMEAAALAILGIAAMAIRRRKRSSE